MPIDPPELATDDPAYDAALRKSVELALMQVIDEVSRAGWNTRRTYPAVQEVIAYQAKAYEEDPDPVEAAMRQR
jgi:hypothetical protein